MKRFYCILILVVCLAGITHAKEQVENEPLLRHRVSLSYGAPSIVGLYTNMFVTIGSIFSASRKLSGQYAYGIPSSRSSNSIWV